MNLKTNFFEQSSMKNEDDETYIYYMLLQKQFDISYRIFLIIIENE